MCPADSWLLEHHAREVDEFLEPAAKRQKVLAEGAGEGLKEYEACCNKAPGAAGRLAALIQMTCGVTPALLNRTSSILCLLCSCGWNAAYAAQHASISKGGVDPKSTSFCRS